MLCFMSQFGGYFIVSRVEIITALLHFMPWQVRSLPCYWCPVNYWFSTHNWYLIIFFLPSSKIYHIDCYKIAEHATNGQLLWYVQNMVVIWWIYVELIQISSPEYLDFECEIIGKINPCSFNTLASWNLLFCEAHGMRTNLNALINGHHILLCSGLLGPDWHSQCCSESCIVFGCIIWYKFIKWLWKVSAGTNS